MFQQEERSFPRGGKRDAERREKVTKKEKPLKRKKVVINDTKDDTPEENLKLVKKPKKTAPSIVSLKTLSEGMTFLGCVREVNDLELKVNLPGRIIGYVPATKVSEEYSAHLRNVLHGKITEPLELQHMFKVSQFVVVKVEEISVVSEHVKVILTMNPSAILTDISVHGIANGLIVPASVQSTEDHGYVMNCGIPGLRAFLKKSRASKYEEIWNDGRPLAIGQVLRCLVTKCTVLDGYSNIELEADPEKVANGEISDDNFPLSSVIPGMCFQLAVSQATKFGFHVTFNGENDGFVHSNYKKSISEVPEQGQTLRGRVLYVTPLTKIVFFSTHDDICGPKPLSEPFEIVKKGDVFDNAVVVSTLGDNVVLKIKLGKNRKIGNETEKKVIYGYVSEKHLGLTGVDVSENIESILKQKYAPGQVYKCKLLEYDYILQKYNCSLRPDIIKLKYISLDEIPLGEKVKCVVEKSTPREIVLRVGIIKGYVEPIHCTDVPVRHADLLLKPGKKVIARVLNKKENSCEFTLKPTLVHSQNPILTGVSHAKLNVPYDGVVVLVKSDKLLVKFFGNFVSSVPAKNVLNYSSGDLENSYYVGQLVTCYVKKISSEKQTLTLCVQPNNNLKATDDENDMKQRSKVQVGRPYSVCVEEVTSDGLTVTVKGSGARGWIPSVQLMDYSQVADIICQTYKVGDVLQTYCLVSSGNLMFTLSPTLVKYFKSCNENQTLAEEMVYHSIVLEINHHGIIVLIPIPGEPRVFVKNIEICDGRSVNAEELGIRLFQTMLVRITQVFADSMSYGSCRLSRVWDKSMLIDNGVMLLRDFLNSQKKVLNHLESKGHPLGSLQRGSLVKGTVIALTALGAVVNLDCGVRAVIMPSHYKDLDIKEQMIVEGIVMYIDVVNQCVEISLLKEVQNVFSHLTLDSCYSKSSRICIVYVSRPDVVIGAAVSKHTNKYQIICIPSRWHINDLRPSPYFDLNEQAKIVIVRYEEGTFIAVPRKVQVIENRQKKIQQRELKLKEVIQENKSRSKENVLDAECAYENSGIINNVLVTKNQQKHENKNKKAMFDHLKEGITNDTLNFSNPKENKKASKRKRCEVGSKDDNEIFEMGNEEMIKAKRIMKAYVEEDENGLTEKDVHLNNSEVKTRVEENKDLRENDNEHKVSVNEIQRNNVKENRVLERISDSNNKIKKSKKASTSETPDKHVMKNNQGPEIKEVAHTFRESKESLSKENDIVETRTEDQEKRRKIEGSFVSSNEISRNEGCVNLLKDTTFNDVSVQLIDGQKKKRKQKDLNNETGVNMFKENINGETLDKQNEEGKKKKKKKQECINGEADNSINLSDSFNSENVDKPNKENKKARKKNGKGFKVDSKDNNEELKMENEGMRKAKSPHVEEDGEDLTGENMDLKNLVGKVHVIENEKSLRENDNEFKDSFNQILRNEDGIHLLKENTIDEVPVKQIDDKKKKRKEKNVNNETVVKENMNSETDKQSEGGKKKQKKKQEQMNGEADHSINLSENFILKANVSENLNKANSKEEKSVTLNPSKSQIENDALCKTKIGFFWNATLDQLPLINKQQTEDLESSDDESEVIVSKKKKQRMSIAEKREKARQEEERLRKIEQRLLNAEKNPESADDFDRLVMSEPNNSQNWIKYMAYHLQATEIEKARAVAQKALKTISFREEQEKLNVWMALLNLENLFGTQESLGNTLEEAVKMNDSYKVYMQTLNMYSSTKKIEELESMVQLVTKKYKNTKNTWVEAGLALIKCGEIEKSRQLMQRALKILDKRDHIDVLTRFALMENEWGEKERAETLMENIVTSYPKRVDLWCVYVDMLIKSKKIDCARQVLDRAVIQKISAFKIKALFKKYLKLEQDHGTNQGIERVRDMAKKYIEKASA